MDGERGKPGGVQAIRQRLSYANVMATVATFLALGGGSFAIAALSGQEKKTVKRIANRAIKKQAPLKAIVSGDGEIVRQTRGFTGVFRESAGKYHVSTRRSLTGCYTVATLGGDDPGVGLRGDISVQPLSDPRGVYVLTSTEDKINGDRSFTIQVSC